MAASEGMSGNKAVDMVVVYKANLESLEVVLGLLRKEGFSPVTLENPGHVVYRGSANLVRIAVPRDEAPGARSILRKWDQAQQSEISTMTDKLAGPLLCSTVIVAALAVIFVFFGILWDGAPLLFVIWIVVFALMANVEKISRKLKRPKDDENRRM
ncbi:MAG: hypothetical protein AMJ75_08575 [Phycisphaerae bacterium SM1_79]|nr:MAG: hypothetical protein AMJ75_08575 [Phycisphaerae bacterium SM1_79]